MPKKSEVAKDIYFANLPIEEIGQELENKINNYYEHIVRTGRLELWRKSHRQYYAGYYTKSEILHEGEQGELRSIVVNHYKNLLTHLQVMTTHQRPSFDPRAINSDYKSQSQTLLAQGLLDYYMRYKRLEKYINMGVLNALKYGEGWIYEEWDFAAGEEYGEQRREMMKKAEGEEVEETEEKKGDEVKTGDVAFHVFTPIDVIRDYHVKNINKIQWVILRRWVNKYDLKKKYPEFEHEIELTEEDRKFMKKISQLEDVFDKDETEYVPLYTFIHDRCPALPEGKLIEFFNADTVMFMGDLPYTNFPVFHIIPDQQDESPFGYTIGFDLLPLQYAYDALASTIVTNQTTFGVQNITAPKGSGVEVSDLAGGMKLVEYNGDMKPEPLKLLETPPELFNFMSGLEQIVETISGVNSVARGNPEASLKSGAALALVQSMAIQFSSGLQNSYARLLEDLGTGLINLLKDYASVPRIALIAGKTNVKTLAI
jgi:hypothetical protein